MTRKEEKRTVLSDNELNSCQHSRENEEVQHLFLRHQFKDFDSIILTLPIEKRNIIRRREKRKE